MITEISLENFKRFSNLNLKIRNLTVLTGTNSSGKTSILHLRIRANIDRIYFRHEPESIKQHSSKSGYIVVGIFKDHCLLPN